MCVTSYPYLSRTCCPITALPARIQWGKEVLSQLRENETLGEKVLVSARSEFVRFLFLPPIKKLINSPQGSYWPMKESWKSKCTSPGHLLVLLQVQNPAGLPQFTTELWVTGQGSQWTCTWSRKETLFLFWKCVEHQLSCTQLYRKSQHCTSFLYS